MSDGIYDPVTDELRGVFCPAGAPIADLLGSVMPNTPGVDCRITHDRLSVDGDAKTLVRWCCNPAGGTGGFSECPVWRFDKDRLERNLKSLGDEGVMEQQDERTWREDLTGSEYGDTSFMDAIEESVQATAEEMKRTGTVQGSTGVDLDC